MDRSGQSTEWTSQQILDKVLEETPPVFQDVMNKLLVELKKINMQLSDSKLFDDRDAQR